MTTEEELPKSIIVHIDRFSLNKDLQLDAFQEFKELCLASGTEVCAEIAGKIDRPSPTYFVRHGKLEEIKKLVIKNKTNLVIFNNDLSPSQERNLEKYLGARVLDRTALILDIFACRATSHVGKLQVELAQLTHLSTRLVRGWSHLERQKGGIGLRGPGETQLETDRRLIGHRIKNLKKRLEKAHNQKEINRYSRKKGKNSVVALVGYTNAGKTTLFNYLTKNNLFVADMPFATLDSVTRKNNMPQLRNILFSDTVGFISNLPTQLVESFKATLDDLGSADLLLHVVDISDKDHRFKVNEVEKLLKDLNLSDKPIIRVNNKSDKLELSNLNNLSLNSHDQVWISSTTYDGFESLLKNINTCLNGTLLNQWVALDAKLGWLRAELYSQEKVIDERISPEGLIELRLEIYKNDLIKMKHIDGFALINKNQTQEAI
ncbi:MAG: GTPase HflX [Pseudomonadota bacterium]|nr:GTPase HflX [Pseudomonadota bacterium]